MFLLAENIIIKRDLLCFFIFNFAVGSHGPARQEQLLDDLGGIHVHGFRKLSDRELLGDDDRLDLLLDGSLGLLLGTDEFSGLVAASSAGVFLTVDQVLLGALIAILVLLPLVVISVLISFSAETFTFTDSAGRSAASAFCRAGS